MNKGWAAAALAGGMMLAAAAAAMTAETFSDTAQQARYRSLLKELRCMVCQNQALDDSNAELAADMRRVVANMVRDGDSDSDIKEFMTARYGDFVLYRPPLRPETAPLWLLPFALAAVAVLVLVVRLKKRSQSQNIANNPKAD